jgi:glycosyltransferase involved in cell wall biosynthesis
MNCAPLRLCFVVPALDGPISGGTLYNRELCAALGELGCSVDVCSLHDAELSAFLGASSHVFVDTLYLAALPELARAASGVVFLLSHYLPSFVAAGRAVPREQLAAVESGALSAAGAFLVTSEFMREAIEPLVAPEKPILVLPPGSRARLAQAARQGSGALHALVIANLLPGKGIAPLFEALSVALRHDDQLELSIIGRLDADVAYAAHCRALLVDLPALSARVTLSGASSPEQTLAALAESDLLLSASVMESYGMALSDARVSGVPILARAGGHAAAHIESAAGGQLVTDVAQLAEALLFLVRAPAVMAERVRQARRHALSARPWSRVARALLDQLGSLEK